MQALISGNLRGIQMERIEIEVKLNRDRTALLEAYAAVPAEDLTKGITPSKNEPSTCWSAKDHLAHIAGIEHLFSRIIKRHLAGDPSPIALPKGADGSLLPREELMPYIHAMNDEWVGKQRDKSLSEVVALSQKIRSETLALLASLTDEQLLEKVPGAPWADGTIGAIIAINADHSRAHQIQWVKALAG